MCKDSCRWVWTSAHGTNAKSQRCPLFGRYQGKSERRGHLVFVDAEIIRGGPLLEVAGARQRKLGEPGFEQHFVPSTQSEGDVTGSEIYMRQ